MNGVLTKKQQVPRNFHPWLGRTSWQVSNMPFARLSSMLDCDHGEGSHYAVVTKGGPGGTVDYYTVVVDVPLKRFYRAQHPTGAKAYWKGVARRHPGFVQYLDEDEVFKLPEPVLPNERDEENAA